MNPAPKPLTGTLILDLTRVLAGPFCTLVLADLGARVIKIERPDTGDDARSIGPFVAGQSAYFFSVNRNKESIALDLEHAPDRHVFEMLLNRADVLIENFRPGVMEKLGYGWPVLSDRFPRLIFASISGFGQTGPYSQRPAYDMVVQAMGGIMSVTGHPGNPPTRVGSSIGDLAAGLYGAVAIESALLQRQKTGKGERIDIAMLDCQVALLENAIAQYESTGELPRPIGSRHPSITPFDVFRAADGWLVIAVGNDALFRKLCGLLGMPEIVADRRFLDMESRCKHHDALKQLIEQRLGASPCTYWRELLIKSGIPTGPYNTIEDVIGDPHLKARNMLLKLPITDDRSLTVAGNPIKLGARVAADEQRLPPSLDEHRTAILAELGLTSSAVTATQ
ncbi:MAG TPA: CaiB/BaiF CoA-transferase family protein [Gammaproteobacteria bacterium]|nr:CaiB/BaiF CoA-transferase family protein [Gammaproteobacteria bacterium]